MKIKPMHILSVEQELAMLDFDGARKYLDEISFNMRGIFHEEYPEKNSAEFRAVDIVEDLIAAIDIFTFITEKITHYQISADELPKVNSIISSLRYIVLCLHAAGEKCQSEIAEEYFRLFAEKLSDLIEAIDDAEKVFFGTENDAEFIAASNRLFGLE